MLICNCYDFYSNKKKRQAHTTVRFRKISCTNPGTPSLWALQSNEPPHITRFVGTSSMWSPADTSMQCAIPLCDSA